ncbi:MAG: TVP38/TMEM64 family protein [Rhodobacteraceae bacterium]|nr:TVP38/TMEM64 family protein [Paracoccaceae bacterium]
MPNDPARAYLRILPLAAVVIAAIAGFFLLRDTLSFEGLRDNREALLAFRDQNYLLTVGIFVIAYTAIVALSLPGATVATLTGGFLFGTFPGVLFNMTAATLGAVGIFQAVRWGFGDRLAARLDADKGAVGRLKEGLDQNQWSMLFLIRLVPFVPFVVANLVPAVVGVPLRRFVISTFLGIFPGALVFTSVGAGLGAVFARGEGSSFSLFANPAVYLPILGLCALAALPIVFKGGLGRKGA